MLVADIDGDGSIDTGLRMTAPVAQVQADPVHPTKYIEYDVHQSDTLAGTYTSWRRFTSAAEVSIDTLLDVKANANKWYKARYRLITFSGAKTAWSPLTSPGVQPASYANTMPTVLWQASNPIVAKPKAIWLRWQAISASLTHAKEIVVFRHTANNSATAVEIGTAPSGAQRYIDNDDLVAGTTYFYG